MPNEANASPVWKDATLNVRTKGTEAVLTVNVKLPANNAACIAAVEDADRDIPALCAGKLRSYYSSRVRSIAKKLPKKPTKEQIAKAQAVAQEDVSSVRFRKAGKQAKTTPVDLRNLPGIDAEAAAKLAAHFEAQGHQVIV